MTTEGYGTMGSRYHRVTTPPPHKQINPGVHSGKRKENIQIWKKPESGNLGYLGNLGYRRSPDAIPQ